MRTNPLASSMMIPPGYENTLHALGHDLAGREHGLSVHCVIGEVTDARRLHAIMAEYQPAIVFHAAAHTHVPLMGLHPCEAVRSRVPPRQCSTTSAHSSRHTTQRVPRTHLRKPPARRSRPRLSSRRLPLLSAQPPSVSCFQAPCSPVPALPHAAPATRTSTWQSARVMGTRLERPPRLAAAWQRVRRPGREPSHVRGECRAALLVCHADAVTPREGGARPTRCAAPHALAPVADGGGADGSGDLAGMRVAALAQLVRQDDGDVADWEGSGVAALAPLGGGPWTRYRHLPRRRGISASA